MKEIPSFSQENSKENEESSEKKPEGMSEKESEKVLKEMESEFGKRLKCLRRWAFMGLSSAAVFITAQPRIEDYQNMGAWNEHVSISLDSEGVEKREQNNDKITEIFGEDTVMRIEWADAEALAGRKEKRKQPELIGFGEDAEFYNKYVLTSDYNNYPQNWLDGEVDVIEKVDSMENSIGVDKSVKEGEEYQTRGAFKTGGWFGGTALFLINDARGSVLDHELAHANDWETDMDLSLIERQELLLKVHERLTSPDSFKRGWEEGYQSLYMDGTKEGVYSAAAEYWAEVCAEYFHNPIVFQEEFPEDFKLVDFYVHKNDPNYDPFAEKGIFDWDGSVRKEIEMNPIIENYLKRLDKRLGRK